MQKKNYTVKILIIIFVLLFLHACGMTVPLQNLFIQMKVECRVNIKESEKLLKCDLETIFGKEYAKGIVSKYDGLIKSIPNSSGPIPDFNFFPRPKRIFESNYYGYKYKIYINFLKKPLIIKYYWDAKKSKEDNNRDTYGVYGINDEPSRNFSIFYLKKIGFDEEVIKDIKNVEISIDVQDLNFDKLMLKKYDDEEIFNCIKVTAFKNIILKNSDISLEDAKNRLSNLSKYISKMYNCFSNNYIGYSIQFGEKSLLNNYNPIVAYADSIDEEYVFFTFKGNGIDDKEYCKIKYDGVNSNKYVNKINYKRVIKDFLDYSNEHYDKLPINESIKLIRNYYLAELDEMKLEIISYKSDYDDKKVYLFAYNDENVALLELTFELDNDMEIDDLKINNITILIKNGVNVYDKYYDIKNELWKNIFTLCNSRFMGENVVLSVTDNFYKNNINYFEKGISILDVDVFVDKYQNKVYLLKGDNFFEFDYTVEIVDKYFIDDIKFMYNKKYENISNNKYECIENIAKQYGIRSEKSKVAKVFFNVLRNNFDCFTLEGILNLNHSIYYYMNHNVNESDKIIEEINKEDEMRKDIDRELHNDLSLGSVNYRTESLVKKYGIKNVLKYSSLGDEFKLSNGNGADLFFIVVKKDNEKVLLLADFVWPIWERDGSDMTINYEHSKVRKNLNKLINSLTDDIKNNLVETKISNHQNNKYGINLGKDTNDKIFIFSIDEMNDLKKECEFITDWTSGRFYPHILRTAGKDTTTFAFTKLLKLDNGKYDAEYSYESDDYGSVLPSQKVTLTTRPAMWVRIN